MGKLLNKFKNLFRKNPLKYNEYDVLQAIYRDLDNLDGWELNRETYIITIYQKDRVRPKYNIKVAFKHNERSYVVELGHGFFTDETSRAFTFILENCYIKKKRQAEKEKEQKEVLKKARELFSEAFK